MPSDFNHGFTQINTDKTKEIKARETSLEAVA